MNSGKRNGRATRVSRVPTELTQAVIDLTRRYRLIIFAAAATLPGLKGRGPRLVRAVLGDAVQRQLLRAAWLHAGTRYWYLGTATQQDQSRRARGAFTEPAKLRAVAVLRFCCLSRSPKHLLTAEELAQSFPTLARPGLPHGYYFDPAGSGRLGFARVDPLQSARWDRSLTAIQHDLHDHWLRPGFRPLMEAGRFELTYLTALPEKAQRLRLALRQQRRLPPARVHILALRELLSLLGQRRRRGRVRSHHKEDRH